MPWNVGRDDQTTPRPRTVLSEITTNELSPKVEHAREIAMILTRTGKAAGGLPRSINDKR